MTEINPRDREHIQIRMALRDLCGSFSSEYWHKVEAESGYPEKFVKALTDAGWLSALIPEEFVEALTDAGWLSALIPEEFGGG